VAEGNFVASKMVRPLRVALETKSGALIALVAPFAMMRPVLPCPLNPLGQRRKTSGQRRLVPGQLSHF